MVLINPYMVGGKGVHTFPKGILPKMNVIAGLEFELAYYDFAVHRFNHYTKIVLSFNILNKNTNDIK